MSLKAKIEAVIYAAEEPVTLSQLTTLFAAEVPVPEGDEQPPAEEMLEAIGAVPLHEGEGHEVTTIDAAGTMTDAVAVENLTLETMQAERDAAVPEASPGHEGMGTGEERPAAGEGRARVAAPERQAREQIRAMVETLMVEYATEDRGLEIREVAGGYRMSTRPEYHDAIRALVKGMKPPLKLSLPALETLAVIAYKQPVTAPEVAEIRGVDAAGVLAGLISRKLVTTAGRKQVIGRPILYKTTRDFLLRFGLKDIAELPSIEEFEKIANELSDVGVDEVVYDAESQERLSPEPEPDTGAAGEGAMAEHRGNEQKVVEEPSNG